MAGHARYTALVDACALYPVFIADTMLTMHHANLCTVKWTKRIEDEWMSALLRDRPELAQRLPKRRDAMRAAAPDWEIAAEAYEKLMPSLQLPDMNDVHVMAAAIAGHADCIITTNLKDFPEEVLQPHGIEVIHPDDFLVFQLDLDPIAALAAFKRMRARLRNPALTPEEFAAVFERNQLAATAQRIREAADLI
jgi:predicted nucleic acid-binding protein